MTEAAAKRISEYGTWLTTNQLFIRCRPVLIERRDFLFVVYRTERYSLRVTTDSLVIFATLEVLVTTVLHPLSFLQWLLVMTQLFNCLLYIVCILLKICKTLF